MGGGPYLFPLNTIFLTSVAVNAQGDKLSKQTGAEAVLLREPASTLILAPRDLGQAPPPDLEASSLDDILVWGTRNWILSNVPAKLTL